LVSSIGSGPCVAALCARAWRPTRGDAGDAALPHLRFRSDAPTPLIWHKCCFGLMSMSMSKTRVAKFTIGEVVRHRLFPFRGVIFDVDPTFANTEEWWEAIPAEVRPHKDQPFYHLFAENADTEYVAYVSEQNLLPDTSGEPVRHPQVAEVFERDKAGNYRLRNTLMH